MNDPLLPPSMARISGIGVDLFDEDEDDNDNEDLLLDPRLRQQENVVIAGPAGHIIDLETHGTSASASMTGNLSTHPKIVEHIIPQEALDEPADLLWTPIARLFMRPARYRAEWLSYISDMNYERHESLKRGDVSGARWAVIRAHFYSLPRWLLLIPGGFILHLLRRWLGL
jgi:hypothetical protein